MNILVVHCRYRIRGGEDAVVENDIKILREMGHHTSSYILSNNSLDEMGIAGRIKAAAEYVFPLRQTLIIKRIIKEKKIDVIWVHNTLWMTGTAAYEAGRACHIPVIQTIHNYRLFCPNGICFRNGKTCCDCMREASSAGLMNSVRHGCYRGSRILSLFVAAGLIRARNKGLYDNIRFVCLSEFQKYMLARAVPGIREDRIYIKHNHAARDVKGVKYQDRKNRFVYVGRLTREKGIPELLEAWRMLERQAGEEDNAAVPELVICGGGDLEEYVRKYIDTHHLHYVNYMGELPNKEAMAVTADAKSLIYPTRWFEGEPMSIIEAYMLGTPVIATDIGGVTELVEDGITGRLISYDGAVRGMVDIIQEWDRSFVYNEERMSEIADKFSKQNTVKSIKTILKQ